MLNLGDISSASVDAKSCQEEVSCQEKKQEQVIFMIHFGRSVDVIYW